MPFIRWVFEQTHWVMGTSRRPDEPPLPVPGLKPNLSAMSTRPFQNLKLFSQQR